jgi:hypothetical protein
MIDGNVRGLNRDVLQALQQVKNKSEVTPQEALGIRTAILKDGVVDNAEKDLVSKLTAQSSVDIKVENKSSNFSPSTLTFKPLKSEARDNLQSVDQVGTSYADADRGEGMSTADKIGLTADITGIVDPTPISDGISGAISLGKGDFVGAGLSMVSMVPYFGDAVGKPAKIMKRVLDDFPELARIVKSVDDIPALINTLSKLDNPAKIGDTLKTLNNIQKDAGIAYKNADWLAKAKKLDLPTEGPISFVPPKHWNPKNPMKTQDGKGFIDNYGNEWRKGPSRTAGEAFEWDVIPSKQTGIANLSRDGSHVNVSLKGVVTHR